MNADPVNNRMHSSATPRPGHPIERSPQRLSERFSTRSGARCAAAALMAVGWSAGCVSVDPDRVTVSIVERRDRAARSWLGGEPSPGAPERSTAPLNLALGLEDALRLTLRNNTALRALPARRELAEGRLVVARAGILPDLDLQAAVTQLDRATAAGDTRQSLRASLRQPLYRGGALDAAIQAARLGAAQEATQVRSDLQHALHATARGYYEVVLQEHLLAVADAALESAQAQRRDVEIQRAQGVASDYDVLRIGVEVARLRAEQIRQKNLLDATRSELLNQLGAAQGGRLELLDPLRYEPVEAEYRNCVALALAQRADLHHAEAAVAIQEQTERIARARYRPAGDLVSEATAADPHPHRPLSSTWGTAWSIGAVLQFPLFDGLERRGRLQQERARLHQAVATLAVLEERAILEVTQALLALGTAEELVASQRHNLERAQEALRLAETRFREGDSTAIEILDARSAVTSARGQHYQSIHAHVRARLDLLLATGLFPPATASFFDPLTDPLDLDGIPGVGGFSRADAPSNARKDLP